MFDTYVSFAFSLYTDSSIPTQSKNSVELPDDMPLVQVQNQAAFSNIPNSEIIGQNEKNPHPLVAGESQVNKIDSRSLSIDEVLVKKEAELDGARKAISKLHNQLGTVVVTSCSGSEEDASDDGLVDIQTEQKDSIFARKYTFKTNVSNS